MALKLVIHGYDSNRCAEIAHLIQTLHEDVELASPTEKFMDFYRSLYPGLALNQMVRDSSYTLKELLDKRLSSLLEIDDSYLVSALEEKLEELTAKEKPIVIYNVSSVQEAEVVCNYKPFYLVYVSSPETNFYKGDQTLEVLSCLKDGCLESSVLLEEDSRSLERQLKTLMKGQGWVFSVNTL